MRRLNSTRGWNTTRRLKPRAETAMTSDLIMATEEIAHEPLVKGLALIAVSALISRMLFKQKRKWARCRARNLPVSAHLSAAARWDRS